MIHYNENEAKKEKTDHIDLTWIDLGLHMDSNVSNTECVSV